MKTNELMKGVSHVLSDLTTRLQLVSSTLGETFDGNRKLYTACGYKTVLTSQDYLNRYTRQDIAKRVVNAFPDDTWRTHPKVSDSASLADSEFTSKWKSLVKRHKIYNYLKRVDRMAGVHQYAILLVGVDDGLTLERPIGKATDITFLRAAYDWNATVATWDEDPKSPRFGLPVTYNLTIADVSTRNLASQKTTVHYSRIIHVADECTESEVYGTPRMQAVYNRLQDVETISAGSGEMFWKGAFPGFAFVSNPDFNYELDDEALEDEIEEYFHGLSRYLKLTGVEPKALTVQIADPGNHMQVQIDLIAAATSIPARILLGSESGQLASSQDRANWIERVDARRLDFAEPNILRPFVDLLMSAGILPQVNDVYVEWPDLKSLSETERAQVGRTRAEAIGLYARSPGADLIVPPKMFLSKILNFSSEDIEENAKELKRFIGGGEATDMLLEAQGSGANPNEQKGRPSSPDAPDSAAKPKERNAGSTKL